MFLRRITRKKSIILSRALAMNFSSCPAPLLFENFIKQIDVNVREKYQTKVLYPTDTSCDLGFDIFSAIFFMISRYEEYLSFTPDRHGRFKATDTVAYKNNFLGIPVVDIWISLFKTMLRKKFPALKFLPSSLKL